MLLKAICETESKFFDLTTLIITVLHNKIMISAADHKNEKERLKALASYSILDSLSEEDYDDITAIAASICGTNISLISLIDDKRQWFKSHHGLDATETPKDFAFCAHAIHDHEKLFEVQDTRNDLRFVDNPLVTGDPNIRFYAGIPLLSDNGLPLGTLCVIDQKPKTLSEGQKKSLRALSNQVMNMLNLRKTTLTLEKTLLTLEDKNQELDRFAYVAAHDLKSPLIGIRELSQMLAESHSSQLDQEGQQMLKIILKSSDKLKSLIDGLLEYSRLEKILKEQKVKINLKELLEDLKALLSYEHELKLSLNTTLTDVITNRTALEQVLLNLVSNAIKYNDKATTEIEIGVSVEAEHYKIYVKDNGPGIDPAYHQKIFGIFEVLESKDRYGRPGNGIGLATVKKVVENSGGNISLESKLGQGATFTFTLEK